MTAYAKFGSHPPLPVRSRVKTQVHAGKTFLITGAAGGVGAGLVSTLLDAGAFVAAADLDPSRIPPDPRVLPLAVDVANAASVSAMVEQALAWRGQLDGLVNGAAVALHAPPLEHDLDIWRRQFEINVFGAYEAARLVAKSMIERKITGAIVNISSEAGKIGHAETMIAYSATKAALISMTRMLSAALAANDINVNCVCPGSVATPMLRQVADVYSSLSGEPPEAVFEQMVSGQLKRHTTPEEIGRCISFLLSDDAMLIRGQAINVDGGDTPY